MCVCVLADNSDLQWPHKAISGIVSVENHHNSLGYRKMFVYHIHRYKYVEMSIFLFLAYQNAQYAPHTYIHRCMYLHDLYTYICPIYKVLVAVAFIYFYIFLCFYRVFF